MGSPFTSSRWRKVNESSLSTWTIRSPRGRMRKERPHERRFPGAARTPQEDVVRGRPARNCRCSLQPPVSAPRCRADPQAKVSTLPIGSSTPRRSAFASSRRRTPTSRSAARGAEQRLEGGKHPLQLRGQFRFPVPSHLLDVLCCVASEIDALRPAKSGDIRTSSSASADSSSRRSGASACSHRCGMRRPRTGRLRSRRRWIR